MVRGSSTVVLVCQWSSLLWSCDGIRCDISCLLASLLVLSCDEIWCRSTIVLALRFFFFLVVMVADAVPIVLNFLSFVLLFVGAASVGEGRRASVRWILDRVGFL